ncbi:MAG: oligosaccharide flippase family protein [Bacillaceae bacterium]|nr:oligosaccharide flippase family protein [Bacillaceae bacterium]
MKIKALLKNKVVKAGSWYTLTEFFIKGITFLTIPIFTRLLTPADYGVVSLYETWVAIFTIIIGLNLNTSITKGKYDFKDNYDAFVSSIIFLSVLLFFGYIVIFFLFGNFIENIIGLSPILLYFLIFQAYFTFVRNSLIAKLRVEYNYKLVSVILILISILGTLLSIYFILFVFQERPFLGKILGSGILILIVGLVSLIYIITRSREKLWNFTYWKYGLALSTPLIFASLSGLLNAQFDRVIINKYIGEVATGLYSFAYNIGMIVTVLAHALDQAWSPWVYESMENKKFDKIKSRGVTYRNVFSIAYAGLLFISPELIKIMADESYWKSLDIIPYIFIGYYFSYMYTLEVKTEFFYRKTGLISVGTLLSAIINIILNIIFVPKYGYVAAAITTSISFLFLFIFHYLITWKIIKRSIYGFKFHVISIAYVIVITLYYLMFMDSLLMRIIGIIIILTIALYILRRSYIH